MRAQEQVVFEQAHPGSAESRAILWQFYREVVERYYERETADHEVEEAMAGEPSDDLVAPTGLFVLARTEGRVVGCGGVRFVDAHVGELTRVFVVRPARGTGLAGALVGHLEGAARVAGLTTLRLDTRSDLVEARGLYARLGYEEIDPVDDRLYADHWFSKAL